VERRSRSDPESLQAMVDGTASRVGLDLARLKELKSVNYKPLMEYLGYIQVQRGENETLLFVRMKDLDEMADLRRAPEYHEPKGVRLRQAYPSSLTIHGI